VNFDALGKRHGSECWPCYPQLLIPKKTIKISMQSDMPSMTPKQSKSLPKPTLEEIKNILQSQLPQLREEYSIRDIWLFGSYVRGDQHKRSDLDVLVEFDEVPALPKFISLERKLREIAGINVDLVSVRSLKGEAGKRILQEKVVL
jgi:uncharacterized protein